MAFSRALEARRLVPDLRQTFETRNDWGEDNSLVCELSEVSEGGGRAADRELSSTRRVDHNSQGRSQLRVEDNSRSAAVIFPGFEEQDYDYDYELAAFVRRLAEITQAPARQKCGFRPSWRFRPFAELRQRRRSPG